MTGFQEDLTKPCIVFIIPWRVVLENPKEAQPSCRFDLLCGNCHLAVHMLGVYKSEKHLKY